jgi:hypothetical protein
VRRFLMYALLSLSVLFLALAYHGCSGGKVDQMVVFPCFAIWALLAFLCMWCGEKPDER